MNAGIGMIVAVISSIVGGALGLLLGKLSQKPGRDAIKSRIGHVLKHAKT